MSKILVRTGPSLALIKYWGKADIATNLPATSSLAITLEELYTETAVTLSDKDTVHIEGLLSAPEHYKPFFDNLKKKMQVNCCFEAKSYSNFPAAAGLASSSSGFAALAFACAKLIDKEASLDLISELARVGSASAARALFGGFTILEREAAHAEPLFGKEHWPALRVIVATVKTDAKKISSRKAMELARTTSPYFPSWVKESETLFQEGVEALKQRDLARLGPLMRKSYLMMFSTMFTSSPPVLYWEPESLSLIKECEELRSEGFAAWETMDAGPQVKIFCLAEESTPLLQRLKTRFPQLQFLLAQAGDGARIL